MSTATVLLFGDDEFRSEIVTITPADARKILADRNTHNRALRRRAVVDYARDMAAGQWKQNGEAVKFAYDGTLLDGQHRLAALVEADVALPMLVVTGLPLEAQETMDSGKKRTASDVFGLRGETNYTVLASVLRRIWMWEQDDHKFTATARPTTAECAALLARHPEIRRSAEIASRIHGTFRYLPQSITGTAHFILSRISVEDAVWFFARIGDGAELPVNHPVLTLRNRVMKDRADHKKVHDSQSLAYVMRAWNAVRDGRSLSQIIQPPDAAMPMPH